MSAAAAYPDVMMSKDAKPREVHNALREAGAIQADLDAFTTDWLTNGEGAFERWVTIDA